MTNARGKRPTMLDRDTDPEASPNTFTALAAIDLTVRLRGGLILIALRFQKLRPITSAISTL